MKTHVKLLPALLASLCAAGPALAQDHEDPATSEQAPPADEPSMKEVLESQQFKSALTGVLRAMQQSGQAKAGAGDGGSRPATAGQSDAMSDAAGVAAQAFGFAAENPDATEAEKQAAAERMMQGVFEGELADDAVALPQARPQPAQPAKDYGDYDEKDYGDYDER